MATCMRTMTTDLYSHGRSDPEYYLPNHTEVEAKLNLLSTVPLRGLGSFNCSAFYPAATHLYSDDGMPFLRCVDIVNYPLISRDQPFARIPQSFVAAHSTIRSISAGDIVISKVGTPCYASILGQDVPLAAMTRTVLGMSSIRKDLVNPYYLIAFLRSRYGFDQLMRERELTIQYQLTLERTRKVRVYLPDRPIQDDIGSDIESYYQSLRGSVNAYNEAQHLLESELGLDKLSFQKPMGYTARFSDLEQSRRLDPEHFYPAFEYLVKHLPASVTLTPLFKLIEPCQTGVQPIYSEKGTVPVINSRHVLCNKIDHSSCRQAFEINRVAMAQPEDVLLNATGAGTLGRASALLTDSAKIFDVCIVRIRPHSIDPVYLAAFLNTMPGQLQVERHTRGSSGQLHLYPRDVSKIQVWNAPKSFQREVRRLIEEAHKAEAAADQFLARAKTRVEQLIEEAAQS